MATTKAQIVETLLSGLVDSSGTRLAGGKVYTYEAGTTTPKVTWTDSNKSTPAANPIILSASGTAQIYADGNYKFRVDTSNDVTVNTWDNLTFRFSDAAWVDWIPVYGAQAGTFPGTSGYARYHRVGDICYCEIYAFGSPSTTPDYLTFTLPFAVSGLGFEAYHPTYVEILTVRDIGHIYIPTAGTQARVYTRNHSAWSAALSYFIGNFFYEI